MMIVMHFWPEILHFFTLHLWNPHFFWVRRTDQFIVLLKNDDDGDDDGDDDDDDDDDDDKDKLKLREGMHENTANQLGCWISVTTHDLESHSQK